MEKNSYESVNDESLSILKNISKIDEKKKFQALMS